MLFDQAFIEKLEGDPLGGILEAFDITFDKFGAENAPGSWTPEHLEVLLETTVFINLAIKTNNFDIRISDPVLIENVPLACRKMLEYLREVRAEFKELGFKARMASKASHYEAAFKTSFAYEFTQGDLDRIQVLISELRSQLTANTSLEESHKQRLLRRLEKLQSELHKRVPDVDRFFGLVGDAGVVFGKLGNDAKPIVDRVKELMQIAWKTQAHAEELPTSSPNPMLEHAPEDE
jgi:hypothetical protein